MSSAVINDTATVEAITPPPGGAKHTGVVPSRHAGVQRVIDGGAVIGFSRERAERMKNPLTAAIYSGLADRVARGFFDVQGSGNSAQNPEVSS